MTIDAHDSEPYSWTMARRAPHVGLAEHVGGYTGYVERSTLPLRRREVANGNVVVIISFGEPIDVQLTPERPPRRYTSFVAGLHDHFVVTEHGGRQFGIQLDLTPLGAYRILGVPPSELAHRVVALDELEGTAMTELAARLEDASDWPARFDVLDRELLRGAGDGPELDPAVMWAWRQLVSAHGGVPVGVLADEIGWSRRHFAARFRHHVGLAPKVAARVLRFQHAVDRLSRSDAPDIGAVAASSGYSDHSHLVREFHELAGCPPTALLDAQLPDGGGFAG
jgi:AraC-like DNA-binding protein